MAEILFFGRLRDSVGASALTVAIPAGMSDTQSLRAWLGGDYPALLDPGVRTAVNAVLHADNAPFAEGDEIAFLPPMSGG